MARKPSLVSTRRPSPATEYDSLPGLGRAVVRVEEQVQNLEEKFDQHAAMANENHDALSNKMDQLMEAVGQYGQRLTGFVGELNAQRGDLDETNKNLRTVAGRVEASELTIRGFEKKEDFVQGAAWAFNWTFVKIGGAICALVAILAFVVQYQPWKLLTGG